MPSPNDSEIEVIAAVSAALAKLEDPAARERVISYVLARYMSPGKVAVPPAFSTFGAAKLPAGGVQMPVAGGKELAGIAKITDAGDMRITARNLKAKNKLDAAMRLAHVAIYAYEKLTGGPISSRKTLTPILKHHRLYDGNARNRLAKEKGIVRDGDNLSLDAHAVSLAERYCSEILDDSVEGQWKP